MFLQKFVDGKPDGIALEITFESDLGDDYIYLTIDECAKMVQCKYNFTNSIEYHIENTWGGCLAIITKTQITYY